MTSFIEAKMVGEARAAFYKLFENVGTGTADSFRCRVPDEIAATIRLGDHVGQCAVIAINRTDRTVDLLPRRECAHWFDTRRTSFYPMPTADGVAP